MSKISPAWYDEGLCFSCTQCGNCCRGAGNVWISDEEIAGLADLLDLRDEEFREIYVRRSGRRGLVLRQKRNQDCIFWGEPGECEVYDLRPRQCRTYPFWNAIVQSSDDWESEQTSCPGVGKGAHHSREEIDANLAGDGIPGHRTHLRMGAE